MDRFRHLFPPGTSSTEDYKYPRDVRGGAKFLVPQRSDRRPHGNALIGQLQAADKQAREAVATMPAERRPAGTTLEFVSDPGFKLYLQGLEMRRSGIELCNSHVVDEVMYATVFVPDGKIEIFVRKFQKYIDEEWPNGKPRNKQCTESITQVRIAALPSFWTDAKPFPNEKDKPLWWEIWLREPADSDEISNQFRQATEVAGIQVSSREIRFRERRVLLAQATVEQWARVENLFDMLAELREAKRLAGEILELTARDQAGLIEEALTRIVPPSVDAPAVCLLDRGVNREHALLRLAISETDVLSSDPNWSPADRHGHGTEMAGLALYGCLTGLFNSDERVTLGHRLESVKILPDYGENDPDLYGDITDQAVSRIEIESPHRKRGFCLTVTTDDRDKGFPSSWSGALDQNCVGVDDDGPRLVLVSAGNTPRDERHKYSDCNHFYGVEDPAQAWNAITVGAFTEKVVIESPEYADWRSVAAEPGRLSPASRTSLIWGNRSWPLKPEIVMEGGNNAIDPSTDRADDVDDLSLLTTCLEPTGKMLTTSGETSGATALASRYAAIILANYPDLWPETVRGLLIHSARWTDAMLNEFPKKNRESRLRCYGYGVPDLDRALGSVANAATVIIEDSLQPYGEVVTVKDGKKTRDIKTKDMHLHEIPWPTRVLETMGETEIRLRVTLSYFIEPSPGQLGWTRQHAYRSHGLRFDVKRPLETHKDFHKRLSKAAQDEDEDAVDHGKDNRNWAVGLKLRNKGSIHSDTWTGTAAELATCGHIAVYTVSGWWKDRGHLKQWNRQARYSLIVTIETDETDVDLYTPIANQIGVAIETDTEA